MASHKVLYDGMFALGKDGPGLASLALIHCGCAWGLAGAPAGASPSTAAATMALGPPPPAGCPVLSGLVACVLQVEIC